MARQKSQKRRFDLIDEFQQQPPEKVVSDGDLLVKSLSEKQLNKTASLNAYITNTKTFQHATEVVPLNIYASGVNNLQAFKSSVSFGEEIENFKRAPLLEDEIRLFLDYNKHGIEYLESAHKNLTRSFLQNRIDEILKRVTDCNVIEEREQTEKSERHKSEFGLSVKPNSTETKLLQFSLQCSNSSEISSSDPINYVKELSKGISADAARGPILSASKRRRKLRKLDHKLATSTEESCNGCINYSKSQWDKKEAIVMKRSVSEKVPKVYSCKPQKFYTIINNEIVPLNPEISSTAESSTAAQELVKDRFSTEEIKAMPKFANYVLGEPTNKIYVKNLSNNVKEEELHKLFKTYNEMDKIESIKLMNGRMRGQAFVAMKNKTDAIEAIGELNGTVIRNKPIVMQFSNKCTTS